MNKMFFNFKRVWVSLFVVLNVFCAVQLCQANRALYRAAIELECIKKNVWYTQDLILRKNK